MQKLTEATVQAELYMALRAAGLSVSLEERMDGLIADVALYYPGTHEIYALIEVKRKYSVRRRGRSAQAQKYDATGLPWCYCQGLEDIPDIVHWAEQV